MVQIKEKKNILINTWYENGFNYGQLLQAYALQKYIQIQDNHMKEFNVQLLCYEMPIKKFPFYYSRKLTRILRVFLRMKKVKVLKFIKFKMFIKKYISISSVVYNTVDLEKYLKKTPHHLLLIGSDQVWNPEGNLRECFFWPVKGGFVKASYASGLMRADLYFSNRRYQIALEAYRDWIQQFDYLSVRETDGKRILNTIVQNEVRVVLDPTFLLTPRLWKEIMKAENVARENYILVYLLGNTKKILDDVFLFLQKKNINTKVYIIEAEDKIKNAYNFKIIKKAGPEEFLAWIYYARWVVTNSFHGTVFSIIFQKNFYALPAIRKGFDGNKNRILELLNNLDIRDRYMEGDINGISEMKNIDYKKLDYKLERYILDSKKYLKTILESI